MGIFGTLFKTATDIVALPIAVAKDVVDASIGEEATATVEQLIEIKEDLDKITE